ncbi:MAG: response regulator [Proteobacteria bacterium]|nr:response regulator [Pseudomonadota bacterium]MBU4471447.1 response regulator [Pseudomonadota bacterium]MCG2752454.1 response regulator [Desulfobacteraceae bacterium]
MAGNPTYEQLEQKIRILEKEVQETKRREFSERKKLEEEIFRRQDIEREFSILSASLITSSDAMDISFRVMETSKRLTKNLSGQIKDIEDFLEVPELETGPVAGGMSPIESETPGGEKDLSMVERLAALYTLAIERLKYRIELLEAQTQKTEDLEEMIRQRTIELENAKENLEQEIEQRMQMEKDLVQADKMISLGTLVSGVAHEINNPNNFIMLNAPLLNEVWQSIFPVLEEKYKEHGDFSVAGLPYSEMKTEVPHLLHGIEEGSRRIQRIISDLKEYSRKDRGIMEDSVSINEVVLQSLKLVDPMIKKTTQRFSVEYGQDLPLIKGNNQKLGQVVINLIQNACQALADCEKGIWITTDFDEPTGDIVIRVKDEGPGIPEDVLAHIMDPFFTTKRDMGGTGLGLAVSSNIIKEHNGKIQVSSWPGQSVFEVHLPTREKGKLKKILVVDDDRSTREMIYKILSRTGDYSIQKVSTGTEASVKLGIEKPDLVILDMQMPDMNGVEICRLIRTSPELTGIKVVIITGYPGSRKVKEATELGFGHILAKPFEISELLQKVDDILK